MPNITAPLPFPATVPAEPAPSNDPLTAHETLAAAALVVRIDAARRALDYLGLPFWVWIAAYFNLTEMRGELTGGDPFTVRLRLRYPPELPEEV